MGNLFDSEYGSMAVTFGVPAGDTSATILSCSASFLPAAIVRMGS